MRRLAQRLTPGPGGLIGVVLALAVVGSGGALIVGSEIAARSGERSAYLLEEGSGTRFEEVVRVRSDDNAGTSVAFSRLAYPEDGSARTVVIGRDDVFADNLAAGLLQSSGPLLLTDSRALNATVRDEIRRLGARNVFIVGGRNAIAPAIEQELRDLGLGVTRLAGATRIETALAIAEHVAPTTGKAVLVRARDAAGGDSSQAWADSLAAGAFAAAAGVPVLLTDTATLHPSVAEWLRRHEVRDVFAVGGRAAISPAVLDSVHAAGMNATRVAGAERTETAVAVAERLWGYDGSQTAERVVLVDGFDPNSWAAGVAAASYAARNSAPLVLANGSTVPPATERWIERGGGTLVCGEGVRDDACDRAATAPPTASPAPGTGSPTPTPSPSISPRPTPSPDEPMVVRLRNSSPGRALFDVDDLLPGGSRSADITIVNAGDVSLDVRLFGLVEGPLAQHLELDVFTDPDGENVQVFGRADQQMQTLADFAAAHADWSEGIGEWRARRGRSLVYRFVVHLPESAAETLAPGLSATTTFVWEGRN